MSCIHLQGKFWVPPFEIFEAFPCSLRKSILRLSPAVDEVTNIWDIRRTLSIMSGGVKKVVDGASGAVPLEATRCSATARERP